MKCSKCGAESPRSSRVCLRCGKPFEEEKREVPPDLPKEPKKKEIREKQGHSAAWTFFSWIGFAFGILLALACMPYMASVLFLLFAFIAMPIDSLQNMWRKVGVKGAIKGILLVVLFFAGGFAPLGSDGESPHTTRKEKETVQTVSNEKEEEIEKQDRSDEPVPEKVPVDIISNFDTTGYMRIDENVLFEYGNYMGGEKVVTVVTAYQVGGDIKVKTENNDGYFHSIICKFDMPQPVQEGDVLTIAGTIKGKDPLEDTISFLETPTVTLEHCKIIGFGEIKQEIEAEKDSQVAKGKEAKAAFEATIAENKKQERDAYISQCETVKYSDVERNPDNYDGKFVKISGKVIQVSEGWFDTVTLRVDCGGNVWLVSYSREEGESRILEDDYITCYGKCKGVSSYKTVLGATVTIPGLDMEYYD